MDNLISSVHLFEERLQMIVLCCRNQPNKQKGLPRSTKGKDVRLRQEDKSVTYWNDNG